LKIERWIPFLVTKYSIEWLKIGVILLLLFTSTQNSFSQSEEDSDEPSMGFVANAYTDSLRIYIHQELNIQRYKSKLDSLSFNIFLNELAADQAEYMAINGENKSTRKNGRYKTIEERSKHNMGSALLDEATFKLAVKKGKIDFSEDYIAGEIMKLILKSKEYPFYLNNPSYTQVGISARLNQKKNNVFVSVVFGSYKSLNEGTNYRKVLRIPFTKKAKELSLPENKSCLNCDKFKDYALLYEGIKIEKGEIFLFYHDSKQLKKLLKKPTDGLAIDIVQKTQYTFPEGVITNYNLPSRGILLKTIRPENIFFLNPVQQKSKTKVPKNPIVYISLGKIPKKLKGDFELNLLVIQNNKVCKSLKRSYIENEIEKANVSNSFVLSNENYLKNTLDYNPKSESSIINFIVPFQKNKFTYDEKDIEPILNALNEPEFIIDGVYIYSYSSIEGDSAANTMLQKKRAESLKDAIIKINNREIPTFIKTQDSWDLFRLEVEDTKFEYLSSMKKKEAIAVINGKQMSEDLESILAKGRFARIVMDISYDLSKEKLELFCSKKINSSIKKGKLNEATEILEFANKNINSGAISNDFIEKLNLSTSRENINILNNAAVYKFSSPGFNVTENELELFENYWNVDSNNCLVSFNYLNLLLKFNYLQTEQRKIKKLTKIIEDCNEISQDKKNQMNLSYQFAQLKYIDTLPDNEVQKRECISQIKSLISRNEDNSIETNTTSAKIFNANGEYELAASIIEPYLNKKELTENAVFTYISSCAQIERKIFSKNFELAMEKASDINSIRFCELFGAPCLSFQLLENPYIKQLFSLKNCDPDHPILKKEIVENSNE
jgi:hypothetical protein